VKIIDKINTAKRINQKSFSFEFFPPKTPAGLRNFYDLLSSLKETNPTFVDITWGAGGSSQDLTLDISKNARELYGVDVMMHLTCTGLTKERIAEVLCELDQHDVHNILCLRGDPPKGESNWQAVDGGFRYAKDLVKFVRERHGDTFGIAVAGYPEGHLESPSKKECVQRLKEKVDQGADFVVTQLFYDIAEFEDFLNECVKANINVPIIPGVLPIQTYQAFERFTSFCKIKVPQGVNEQLLRFKNNDEDVQKFGVEYVSSMCDKMLSLGVPGLHFYTMNSEQASLRILEKIGMIDLEKSYREMPWRTAATKDRQLEDVRPIFWSNRPTSYLTRTKKWNQFPNGRWGQSDNPAFADLSEYYMLRRAMGIMFSKEERLKMYGSPKTCEDIADVFVKFCSAELPKLPWSEVAVRPETMRINQDLIRMNRKGFLTINSQPQVNGVSSTDPDVGWGGDGGRVYQKAYVEFFTSKTKLDELLKRLPPSCTYHAVNVQGESIANTAGVNAVTWGVFPGREIIQPTVVDPSSFMIWKDEAFRLWLDDWADLYAKDSESYKLIQRIYDEYYLVNVVENDYVAGKLFDYF
jgi:methylenetetrahydrofolate reductase (NADPH)